MAKNKGKHGVNHSCCESVVEREAASPGIEPKPAEPVGFDVNDLIGRRAHEIWEAEQRPVGRDLDHWLRAEKEVNGGKPDAP